MKLSSLALSRVLAVAGGLYFAAIMVLIVSKAPLGSGTFYAVAAAATLAYAVVVARVWHEPVRSRRLLFVAFAMAAAFRIPPAVAPVGVDSDMVRYLWDGRVQQLGYNPYSVRPDDLTLAHTHRDRSAAMPSRHDRTPYPPAAQIFFRFVVSLHDSTLAMKLALVGCDLLTMIVLWRWLHATGRSEWLTLTYAWNPLVILEVSHSGHIDALGALWTVAAAFWLSRRRTQLATLAFVLAVTTKLMPIVLAPLFIGRIRRRDVLLGAGCLAALYLPYWAADGAALGAVPNVVERVRFNSPIFSTLSTVAFPRFAAGVALVLALAAAVYARVKLSHDDPAAWAWPMAIAIACAPVIYPWYLLYLTPFLFTTATLPLAAWTISSLPVYEVWRRSRLGYRWITPPWVMAVEFGAIAAAVVAVRRSLTPARSRTPGDDEERRLIG